MQSFEIGDKILRYCAQLEKQLGAKLQEKWLRPYWIHDVIRNKIYKLRTLDNDKKLIKGIVYGSQLKQYSERNGDIVR